MVSQPLIAALALFASTLVLAAPLVSEPTLVRLPKLGRLASQKGKYFGTATQSFYFQQNATYDHILTHQFTQYTPENEMKWSIIEPERGMFNFTGGDLIVQKARETRSLIRGHNFCWNSQTPEYITNMTDPVTLTAALKEHIFAVLGRYGKDLYAFDVINEPLNDDANGTLKTNVWLDVLGPSYIPTALKFAHEAAPNVRLYINDFNIEDVNAKSTSMLALAKQLLADGIPLHGIGFESHFIGGEFPGDIAASMKQFTDIGLDVAITELDVRLPVDTNDIASAAEPATQASNYASAVAACLGNARCPGVTVWEFVDSLSWVPGTFPGQGAADLFDGSYDPKSAFTSVASALAAKPTKTAS
jgi:endo-1,4-beta-xylanase